MASKTDGPRATLIADWDRIRDYEQTAAQSLADARGALTTAHDQDVQEVAAAVRKDDPTPDTGTNEATAHADTLRFSLAAEGIALALTNVECEIALAVQKELGFQVSGHLLNVEPSVPGARPAGEVVWARYEEAVEGVIRRRRETAERQEQTLAYDGALAKKQAQKLAWERAGKTSESFVADLDEAEEEALNPPGSSGMPRQLAATGASA